MFPAGSPVDATVANLAPLLGKGDIVIDGGNSFYKDGLRHKELLQKPGVHFLDVGVSGHSVAPACESKDG